MRKDAEAHAEEDKQKRQLAELRNQGESMVFQLEKMIKEQADKLKESDKAALESAMGKVREAIKGDNIDTIKSSIEQLEQASHAFSKQLYEAAQAAAGAAGAAGAAPEAAAPAGDGKKPGEDEAIDAEFEVKKE